jgi:hypothetical protein
METSLFSNCLKGKSFLLNKENRHYHLNARAPVTYGLIISPNVSIQRKEILYVD